MHDTYMKEAIIEAKKAYGRNEVPVGAIIVYKGEIIASAGNTKEENLDVCAHAEILAIREAGRVLGKVNLAGCTLYSTLEPCPMCMGAIRWANISTIYYGATSEDADMIGFRDQVFYDESYQNIKNIDRTECLQVFRIWSEMPNKTIY